MAERRHQTLDVVAMYSTLTMEHWKSCLIGAMEKGSMAKLMEWRYGLQAGLADAAKKGMTNEKIDLWVMKRCKDLEKAARWILKKKHHIQTAGTYKDKTQAAVSALEAKRKRDREFEQFLARSNF